MQEFKSDPTLGRTSLPLLKNARLRETLARLLLGESEQRIACRMGITAGALRSSIKYLYRTFGVRSRGELTNACLEIMKATNRACRR